MFDHFPLMGRYAVTYRNTATGDVFHANVTTVDHETRVLGGPVRLTRSEDCHTYHHQWSFQAI